MRKRWWLAIGAVAVAAAAAAATVSLALTGDGGPRQLSHDGYLRIWAETGVGEPMDTVLARWPKDPYQHFTDSVSDDCYEWLDEARYLYSLCFKDGVLRAKDFV